MSCRIEHRGAKVDAQQPVTTCNWLDYPGEDRDSEQAIVDPALHSDRYFDRELLSRLVSADTAKQFGIAGIDTQPVSRDDKARSIYGAAISLHIIDIDEVFADVKMQTETQPLRALPYNASSGSRSTC